MNTDKESDVFIRCTLTATLTPALSHPMGEGEDAAPCVACSIDQAHIRRNYFPKSALRIPGIG